MKWHFTLEEIEADEFIRLREQLQMPPPKNTGPYVSRAGEVYQRRFFRILNRVSYSFDKLLEELKGRYYKPKSVWIPGDCSPQEATTRTRHDDTYFSELSAREQTYRELRIEFSGMWVGYYNDVFKFRRENGLWLVSNFCVYFPNFGHYSFEGISPGSLHATHSVSGIHDRRSNERSESIMTRINNEDKVT